jgi:hypothetical protein
MSNVSMRLCVLFSLIVIITAAVFSLPAPGIMAENPESQPKVVLSESISSGSIPDNTFTVQSAAPAEDIAAGTGCISGHVYETDGDTAIPETRIIAWLIGGHYYTQSAYSATDGSYNIGSLIPGTYVVYAENPDYLTEYYREYSFRTLAAPVFVSGPGEITGIDFTLDRGYSISGHIFLADGKTPVQGAKVRVVWSQYNWGDYSAVSQEDGSYTLKALYPYSYRISAEASGYVREYYPETWNYDLAEEVDISDQVDVNGIDFTLDKGGSISGHVCQNDGKTPLSDVFVRAYLADRSYSRETATTADGSFSIGTLVPGSYKVWAYTPGYVPEYFDGIFDSNEAGLVVVADLSDTADINFSLEKTGSISGHVYQAGGTVPLYPASVSVIQTITVPNDNNVVNSRASVLADGSYTITRLSPGDYRVKASAPGYLSQFYNGAASVYEAIPVSVALATDTAGIDFSLDAGGGISGHVYQPDGKTPLADASVGVSQGGISTVRTASDGSYILGGLISGSYQVYAGAMGYVSKYCNDVYYAEEASPVEVVAPDITQNVDFILEEGGSISGSVYGPDAKSLVVGDFHVNAIRKTEGTRPPGTLIYAEQSPKYGYYLLQNLVPGEYQVRIYDSRYMGEFYDGIYSENKEWVDGATTVEVVSGQNTPDIDFSLEPTPSVSGHVFQTDGKTPIEGVRVNAMLLGENSRYGSAYSGSDGSYSISVPAPGDYAVYTEDEDFLMEYYKEFAFGTFVTPVHVNGSGDTAGIDFTLDRGGSISGRVTLADGKTPVPGVRVYAGCAKNTYSTTSLEDGSYLIDTLYPDSYRVYVQASGYVLEYYNETHYYDQAEEIEVKDQMDVTGINIALDKGYSISGHVYQADGVTPLANASVRANLMDNVYSGQASTASDGSYTIENLVQGEYELYAYSKGYIREFYYEASDSKQAEPVNVSEQPATTDIDFSLGKGGSISGHVYQADGKTPLSIAHIEVTPVPYDKSGLEFMDPHAIILEDGSYTISGLSPGNYQVKARASGYISQYYNGATTAGEADLVIVSLDTDTPGIDFSLYTGGIIAGHVYQSDGKTPIANAIVDVSIGEIDSVNTASDGSYMLSGCSPGSYYVYARALNYLSEYYDDAYYAEEALPVIVNASSTIKNIDFTLDKPGTISGYVYGPDGATLVVGDFRVNAIGVNGGTRAPSYSGDTQPSPRIGYYRLYNLIPGEYQVRIYDSRFIGEFFNGVYCEEKSPVDGAATISVISGQETAGIDFVLENGGSISGKVYQAGSTTPVANAKVYASSTGSGIHIQRTATTDTLGRYLCERLPADNYQVRVEAPGYVSVYYDGAADASSCDPVAVVDNEETGGIDFNLHATCSISGHVFQEDGTTPVSRIKIYARSLNGSEYGYSYTADDGSYRIDWLPDGRYLVTAYQLGYLPLYYCQSVYENSASLIDVAAPCCIMNLDFRLEHTNLGSISGHINYSEGIEAQAFTIRAFDTRTNCLMRSTETTMYGDYQLTNLPAGDYLVHAEEHVYGFDRELSVPDLGAKWYNNVFKQDQAQSVKVVPGQDTAGINFDLETGGTISGYISTTEGSGYTGARIEVYGFDHPDLYAFTYTYEGQYVVGGLPDGRYKVRMTANGYECRWFDGADSKQEATEITIHEAEDINGIDFSLVTDTEHPTVLSCQPEKEAAKVKVDILPKITFSEEMDAPSAANGFFIYPPVVGKVELSGNVLVFTPENRLAYDTTYTINLAKYIEDAAGNSLESMCTWNFSTEKWPSGVITKNSKILSDTSAKLTGTLVNPVGTVDIQVYFEWGKTQAYGKTTAAQVKESRGDFFITLTNLKPDTTYHFRAVAKGDGTVFGKDQVFITKPGYRLTLAVSGQGSIKPEAGIRNCKRGTIVAVTAQPSAGWRFEKWTGGAADAKTASTTVTMNKNKRITAVFKKIVYYGLTLDIKGKGNIDPAAGIYSYAAGTPLILKATAAKGWKFSRWSGGASGSTNPQSLILKGNKKITANFVPAGVTPISTILDQPELFDGYVVNLSGEYRAQEEGNGSPPVNQNDWIMLDESGAIWVHGGNSRFGPADMGKEIQLAGKVRLKNGTPYVQFIKLTN